MITSATPFSRKCLFCKIDLNTRSGFETREDKDTIKYCSSKCRKADIRNSGKMQRSKAKR